MLSAKSYHERRAAVAAALAIAADMTTTAAATSSQVDSSTPKDYQQQSPPHQIDIQDATSVNLRERVHGVLKQEIRKAFPTDNIVDASPEHAHDTDVDQVTDTCSEVTTAQTSVGLKDSKNCVSGLEISFVARKTAEMLRDDLGNERTGAVGVHFGIRSPAISAFNLRPLKFRSGLQM